MSRDDQLSLLFAAEQAEQRSAGASAAGLEKLEAALEANSPALAVAHGPLKLGLSVAAQSLLGPVLVGFGLTSAALGLHAALQPAPTAHSPHVRPAPARSVFTTPRTEKSVAEARKSPAVNGSTPSEPPSGKPGASAKEQPSTFAAELRLIKAAKSDLDAGRPLLAGVWLDEHARLYPRGVFAKEREALRSRMLQPPTPLEKAPPSAPPK